MNKKLIIIIFIVVILLVTGALYFLFNNSNKQQSKSNVNERQGNISGDNVGGSDSAVIYFSATGTTEKIAKYISEIKGNDIIEIIPKEEYTSDDLEYSNDNSRASKEQNDSNARPEIENSIDISNYDTIYLGYPIWWGDVPKIILTFAENNNLEGKTIIPFSTSHSSSINSSVRTLKAYDNLTIKDGRGFFSSTTKSDVESWLKNL